VKRNAPEINWDYAVIQRLSYDDLSTRLLPFNLAKAILDHDDESNLLLQPGDIVTIFSQTDLMVPIAKQSRFVRFEGEFQAAGIYQAELGETLRGLTARTGGVTKNAYLFGAEFTRESTRIDQQKRLDSFLDTMERDINRTATTAGQNASGPEDTALLQQKVEGQRRLLTNMRQVKATGRIVLGIKPGDTNIDALPDLILEDGDKLIVPNRSDTINVMGSVYNENAYIYEPGRHVGDYLRKAGGARRDADQSRMFVIRADASVVGYSGSSRFWTGGIESLRLMPGDTIVVPVRLDRTSFMRGLRDWTQIISQFAIGAAAIKVIGP
jgi:polysaccharide export outer membrane protein